MNLKGEKGVCVWGGGGVRGGASIDLSNHISVFQYSISKKYRTPRIILQNISVKNYTDQVAYFIAQTFLLFFGGTFSFINYVYKIYL